SGAIPAFAEGDYVAGGRAASQAWSQPSGPAPRMETGGRQLLAGGDDQYFVGPIRSLAWAQPSNGMMPAATSAPRVTRGTGNFAFASQGD
ncbi:MAG TPA: hypothetical protein VIL69_21940, partial [Roseomonas sp.]